MRRTFFSGIGILIFFLGCTSAPPQKITNVFLELNLGDNIDYSLFTEEIPVTETPGNEYRLKAPRMVYIFGKQPSRVSVFLDDDKKISNIFYFYSIGERFTINDVEKALTLFREKTIGMEMQIGADKIDMQDIIAHLEQSSPDERFIEMYKDDAVKYYIFLSPKGDGRNYLCTINIGY